MKLPLSPSSAAALSLLLAPTAAAQITSRVSVATGGGQAFSACRVPGISADGRYVVFQSGASELVAGDTNGRTDLFLRDRQLGTTERVSLGAGGAQANDDSSSPSVSADGRFVAFWSSATNLVAGDTNATWDVFVRDRQLATTERISVGPGGLQSNDASYGPRISADGRFVAFQSLASNLVVGDGNGVYDVFVRDLVADATERVSVGAGGVEANSQSSSPTISADGRYVAFHAFATNLVAGDTNGAADSFLRDRIGGTTERVSVGAGGAQGNDHAYFPFVSADGRWVVFESSSSVLVAGDTNGAFDVFVRDRQLATTERVSVADAGGQSSGASQGGTITADGRYVAFRGTADDLVPGDTNAFDDVFVRDRQTGRTARHSVSSSGAQSDDHSSSPAIASGGRYLAFSSDAMNLVAGDSNLAEDVFVRDGVGTDFTSVCHPGTGGVIACPCGNPPSGAGRGCDNSSSTGGATLAAAGVTSVSADTLVFTTSGEKPTALSIVLQGTTTLGSGSVYGQGVRCVGGTLKRLYTKPAVGGSITAPAPGDPSVTARSAALGDPILGGQDRWYLVYYRDPIVLGGCPVGSTFNATQTGRVAWSP